MNNMTTKQVKRWLESKKYKDLEEDYTKVEYMIGMTNTMTKETREYLKLELVGTSGNIIQRMYNSNCKNKLGNDQEILKYVKNIKQIMDKYSQEGNEFTRSWLSIYAWIEQNFPNI